MRLNTKVTRNLAFVGMLTALPVGRLGAVDPPVNCGPEWCDQTCQLESEPGGYFLWQACDSGSCAGEGCAIGGSHCTHFCIWCQSDGWFCNPL